MTTATMTRGRALAALALIAVVFVATRHWLASTPLLSETYYDEALTGLMGLAIFHGAPQVFYWGQPYLGAIEAYVAAAGFWLAGPSTLALRMAEITAAVFWAWSCWSLAGRIGGPWSGLLAGLWIALPPVFLSFAQLSAHGQSLSMTLGALVLASAAALVDERPGPRGRAVAWTVLGVAGGLGWWASQMMGMFLVAAAATILVARPRVLRSPGPYLALALFAVGSLPLWLWNLRHEWATFRHLASWGEPLPPAWLSRAHNVIGAFLMTADGFFWDGKEVVLPPGGAALAWVVVPSAYGTALGVALWQPVVWGQRLLARRRPWQEPLDVVVVAFWLTVAAHLLTWFGTSGVLRYSMTFYVTLPVLGAVGLVRVGRWPRGGFVARAATGTAVALLFAFDGLTHLAFTRSAGAGPWRPVDALIRELTARGVRACYADSRIAQVITFESAERIVCADYYGLRNFAFLQAVDAVEDPAAVAIVTHRLMEAPAPEVMARALGLIGARSERTVIGDYVVFHHFQPPDPAIRPVEPHGWRATASTDAARAAEAFDRKVWTQWTAAHPEGQWLQLDLGGVHRLAGATLEATPHMDQAPGGLRIETSLDARHWDLAAADGDLIPGVHWWKGHPRVDDSGRVVVRMAPRPARHVRFGYEGSASEGKAWGVTELFLYEAADAPWQPPAPAREAFEAARQEMAHWMDDPGGPHPKRAPVTYAHRRAQVAWSRVFATANAAMAAAPEWEEAHHLYGRALDLAVWSGDWDEMVVQSRKDGAWLETLRFAELAARDHPNVWRSGRAAARAEALAQLGRTDEAAQARTEAEQRATPEFRVRFAKDLELIRLDAPPEATAGTTVVLHGAWRAARPMAVNYQALVHLDGPGHLGQEHRLGESFGTSAWAPGERVEQTLTVPIPAEAPPGRYEIRVGVWAVDPRQRLHITAADRPHGPSMATVGTVTVRR